jgi:nucleotide-binding universal stress UspA family protein
MGSHGRKGLDETIFGSVAENVLKKSPVPVLTVNPYTLK